MYCNNTDCRWHPIDSDECNFTECIYEEVDEYEGM